MWTRVKPWLVGLLFVAPYLYILGLLARDAGYVGPIQPAARVASNTSGNVVASPRYWFASSKKIANVHPEQQFPGFTMHTEEFSCGDSIGLRVVSNANHSGHTDAMDLLESPAYRVDRAMGEPERVGKHAVFCWVFGPGDNSSEPMLYSVGHSYVARVFLDQDSRSPEAVNALKEIGRTLEAW